MQQTLIFDCDGVLVNSEVIYISTERAALATLGLIYDDVTYQTRFVGLNGADYTAQLAADYAALDRGPFPADYIDRVHETAMARMADELIALPGLATLLTGHQGPRAVASSSGPETLAHKLALTGLADFFGPHVYSAAAVTRGKPAPDLFLMAAARLDREAAACIVIEDSVNGVSAGVAAGMEVWGFTGGGHGDAALGARLRAAGAARIFAHFDEIAAALASG